MYRREQDRRSMASNGYNSSDNGSAGSQEEWPLFLLEHLATFAVSSAAVLSPTDGMRRLLQMEKTSGIWTQKMQMRLERKSVVILDHENGDVVEEFPMSLIREPTAFTSKDPKELYNNIFIFIVTEDAAGNNPSEMHIFQCVNVSAQEAVEQMTALMAGKTPRGGDGGVSIPPPPVEPPPEPPGFNGNVRDKVSAFNATSSFAGHSPSGGAGVAVRRSSQQDSQLHGRDDVSPSAVGYRGPDVRDSAGSNDETSSTSSEKYERDVAVLNHCFDDIERFIARLQYTAAAQKELERRRKSRKSKKKDLGDGMLSMRARPPPEREFIDIFQKFKLSFNLLAKLRMHIHDPNAPELVHFLFTPLTLIVNASRDPNYASTPNLPAHVISPMLTREAVDLLANCLTSKETELWNSLGDVWLVPASHWKGQAPPYHPVFYDGWTPDYPVDESYRRADALSVLAAQEARTRLGPELKAAEDNASLRERQYTGEGFGREQGFNRHYMRDDVHEEVRGGVEYSGRSDISVDSIERDPERTWLEQLRARGSRVVQVTYPRTGNNPKELTVNRGEFLEVLDDSRKWWKVQNMQGRVGHVPNTIVTLYNFPQEPAQGRGVGSDRSPGAQMHQVLLDPDVPFPNPLYSADSYYPKQQEDHPGNEEPMRRTSKVKPPVVGAEVPAEMRGRKESSFQPPPPPPMAPATPPMPKAATHGDQRPLNIPVPPPPPFAATLERQAAAVAAGKAMKRNPAKHNPGYLTVSATVNEEMKELLAGIRERQDRMEKRLQINKTPNVFITSSSSPAEVRHWLADKKFSAASLRSLNETRGSDLYSMTRDDCEKMLGKEEGAKLFSQIKLSKTEENYKTVKSNQLMAILRERKQRAERNPDEEEVKRDFMGIAEEPDDQTTSPDGESQRQKGAGAGQPNRSSVLDSDLFNFDGHAYSGSSEDEG